MKLVFSLLMFSWYISFMSGMDHTHGKYFVFFSPFCDEYHPVNVAVRWRYGARFREVVTIRGTYKKFILSMGEEYPHTSLPCKHLIMDNITPSGAIEAVAEEDIMLYVQYEHDNFMVYPAAALHNKYKIITAFPESMDRTFVAFTTTAETTSVKARLPPYLKKFVMFNEDRYYPGEIIRVVIGRFDVFMISCDCDLSGVSIESTMKLMVVSGSYKDATDRDIVIEESFPLAAWGKFYIISVESWMYNITMRILGQNKFQLDIGTENSTRSYQSLTDIFALSIYAKDYIYIQSTSPVSLVLEILTGDTGSTVLTTGVPIEQYPKFLCDSFTATAGPTCFVGIGNKTNFQRMFYQNAVNMSFPWLFVVLKRDESLITIPEIKDVWSYTSRILEQKSNTTLYSGAFRVTYLYDSCVTDTSDHIQMNDGVDNDCDGIVDEEFNDDEDTSSNYAVCVMDYNYSLNTKSWVLLSNSMIAILISLMVALIAVGVFIGVSAALEILKGGHPTRPSRVEPVEN